jgi:hypothetical protein
MIILEKDGGSMFMPFREVLVNRVFVWQHAEWVKINKAKACRYDSVARQVLGEPIVFSDYEMVQTVSVKDMSHGL